MIEDKAAQIKLMARVLARMMPPAARVATSWAEKLHDQGVRIHPELAKMPLPEDISYPPHARQAAVEKAMSTLRQMADHWPHMKPLVAQIEAAKTPEERARLAQALKAKVSPEMLAAAEAQIRNLSDPPQ